MAGLTTAEIFTGAVQSLVAPAQAVRDTLKAGTANSPEGMMELSMTVQTYTLGVQTWSGVLKEQFDTMKGVSQKIT